MGRTVVASDRRRRSREPRTRITILTVQFESKEDHENSSKGAYTNSFTLHFLPLLSFDILLLSLYVKLDAFETSCGDVYVGLCWDLPVADAMANRMSIPYQRSRPNNRSNRINEDGARYVPFPSPPKRKISPTSTNGSETAQSTENNGSEDGEASEGGCYDIREKGC